MGLFDKFKTKINDSAYGGFMVSKNVMAGRPIRYTYRKESSIENLNGWTIYSCDDDQEYVSNPNNFVILGATSMNKIAPIMLELFDAPYGTDLCWIYDKKGKHIGFYDLIKNEDTTLEKILEVKLENKSSDRGIDDIMAKDYKQKYIKECKYIWKNYIPKNGQASTLQGELLREIEKIRYEAQNNGNINWDDDYSYFCDFINESLSNQPIFSGEEKEEIASIMNYIKECGIYAQKFNNGEISDEDVDIKKLDYTNDKLYDIICDKIGKLQKENPNPIPYEKNTDIKR